MERIVETYLWAGGCVLTVVVLSLLTSSRGGTLSARGNRTTVDSNRLLHEAQQYEGLARTTQNPLTALMYANYAVAYMRVVDYSTVTANVNLPDLEKSIQNRQQQLLSQLNRQNYRS